ncbi:CAF17-like 4Fe-4S cluster assembly/insertion protein YgfZ [Marilutibacter alkalisoli]|uniref:Folate-binding protein YgfZ n=1 Tax=Marilutibacter alkalisoli TaxID=2591633 RepID=A0A514BS22_9GAMM|nr:folate-binding protein YgfZ [Lysobacter alkalisoli]QDH70194.1 folate-binding protein YgfZ [Lysobacter alkalisoli]
MSDKPQGIPGPFFALPDHALVRLHGRDAIAFAQAQFMNDVNALQDGQWQWSGWLTPKGRVVALFALIRIDAETLWLCLPDTAPSTLIEALERFVFRSKLVLDVPTGLSVSGGFAAPVEAAGNQAAWLADGSLEVDSLELDMGGEGGPRCLRIGPMPGEPDPQAVARWRQADLAHGLPRLEASQLEQWTPQQLSLERLKAFSVKKGCYPGQEIVARTHYLGKAKRGLVRLRAGIPLVPGAGVIQDGRSIGKVVSTADNGFELLAILPLDRNGAILDTGGTALTELPLQSGLDRTGSKTTSTAPQGR